MTNRFSRRIALGFASTWVVCTILAARAAVAAHDTNPEHLLGLLPLAYLSGWCPYFLLNRGGPAHAIARFVLCTASIAFGLAIFEIPAILGIVDYRAVFSTPTPPWRRPGNRPDPELLYVKEGPCRTSLHFQGAEVSRLRGGKFGTTYQCDLELDRNGFRNPAETGPAEIIVVGDSFIEGLQVPWEELLTTRLSRNLGKTVTNLGRTSYGPQQELHVLNRYGIDLAPRTCVWAFYEGNDLQDLGAYASQSAIVARSLKHGDSRSRYERSFTRNAMGYLMRDWIRPQAGLPVDLYTGRLVDLSGHPRALYFTTGIQHGQGGPPLPRDARTPEFRQLLEILASARESCHRQGIDLVVAFLPSKFRVYREVCQFAPGSPCRDWPVDELSRELGSALACDFPDVGFVDLTPSFRAAAANGPLLFLADDTHWSAAGHRLAADLIGKALQARSAFTASHGVVGLWH